MPIRDIANKYGISYPCVYQIVTRRTWQNI